MKSIGGALLIFVLSLFVFSAPSQAYSSNDILSAVNLSRQENNLKPLVINNQLNRAAAAKLADIQKYQYWSHNNPQSGKVWLAFIREAGYSYGAGENLAKGFSQTNKIITAWLNSPSHRENLLSLEFNSAGIAVGTVNYPDGPQTVTVLEFGASPLSINQIKQNITSIFTRIFSKPILAYLP